MSRRGKRTLMPSDVARVARAVRDAVGAEPGDAISVSGPQFHRARGTPAPAHLLSSAFEGLALKSEAELLELGCRPWDAEDEPTVPGHLLYLFPAEWYWQIPEGFEVVDINGQRSKFQRGVTSGDRRFGALAYGVLVPFKGSP